MLIVGHRTLPLDAPENSLEGIRAAAAAGCDAVEIDLRLSLDGRPFLLHDNTMRRTVDPPWPLELTPSFILQRLRLKAKGGPIPTLAEVFDALPNGILLAIDVKTPWAVAALLAEVRRRRAEDRVLIWCTSARALRWVTSRAPAIECAYLKTVFDPPGKRAFIAKAVRLGARAISAHWLAIEAGFLAAAHAAGLKVYSFDEGLPLDRERLASGLDGLITDRPEEARAALAALNLAAESGPVASTNSP
jgi:glycerophosphoryl diester phosphodiesterase